MPYLKFPHLRHACFCSYTTIKFPVLEGGSRGSFQLCSKAPRLHCSLQHLPLPAEGTGVRQAPSRRRVVMSMSRAQTGGLQHPGTAQDDLPSAPTPTQGQVRGGPQESTCRLTASSGWLDRAAGAWSQKASVGWSWSRWIQSSVQSVGKSALTLRGFVSEKQVEVETAGERQIWMSHRRARSPWSCRCDVLSSQLLMPRGRCSDSCRERAALP